jgi:RNA polymerase sigma-70 factor (ECF subfamily)
MIWLRHPIRISGPVLQCVKGCRARRFSLREGTAETSAFYQESLKHLDALYRYAMSLTRDKTAAEDLVQETYLRAVRASNRLAPDSDLKSWLFAIMHNTWLNQVHRARIGPKFVCLDDEKETPCLDYRGSDPHLAFLSKLKREEVRDAIEGLPPLHREIIVLRDLEGFSYKQIANILGCPVGTVMSRLNRARERLRALLGQDRARAARK